MWYTHTTQDTKIHLFLSYRRFYLCVTQESWILARKKTEINHPDHVDKPQNKRTVIVKRYRAKCKENSEKYESMKRRDRERKQAARAKVRKDPLQLDDIREKKRREMRAYRQKKKEQAVTREQLDSPLESGRSIAAKERRRKQLERERKREERRN